MMNLIKFLMQRNAINQISKALSKKWCLFNITLIVSIGDAMAFRCVIELKNQSRGLDSRPSKDILLRSLLRRFKFTAPLFTQGYELAPAKYRRKVRRLSCPNLLQNEPTLYIQLFKVLQLQTVHNINVFILFLFTVFSSSENP